MCMGRAWLLKGKRARLDLVVMELTRQGPRSMTSMRGGKGIRANDRTTKAIVKRSGNWKLEGWMTVFNSQFERSECQERVFALLNRM